MSPLANVNADGGDRVSVRDRISHATLELIAEHGLTDVTMSAVAKRAGVARQTLYNHYPDVDTIVGAVVERHQTDSLYALNAVLGTMTSPLDQLEHLVRHTAAIAHHGHPMIKSGLSTSVQRVLDRYDNDMVGVVEEILCQGIERGELRPGVRPDRDAVIVLRMIETAGELVIAAPDDTADIVGTVLATVRAAVAV